MSPRSLIYAHQALADIANELDYIAQDNPTRADSFALRLEAFLDDAAISPFDLSKGNTDWPLEFRYLVFGNKPHARVVIVTVTAEELIVRNFIGRQNITNQLVGRSALDLPLEKHDNGDSEL